MKVFGLLCTTLGEWIYRQTEDYTITNSCLAAPVVRGVEEVTAIQPKMAAPERHFEHGRGHHS